jgi:hypothetical protein
VPGWCDPELVFLAHARNRAVETHDDWPHLVWLDAGPDAGIDPPWMDDAAAARRATVTLEELLKENRRLDVDLKELKA